MRRVEEDIGGKWIKERRKKKRKRENKGKAKKGEKI